MSTPTANPGPDVSAYRLAPLIVARFVGSFLVLMALAMFAATAAVAVWQLPPDLLAVPLVLGLAGTVALGTWLRRVPVLRLDSEGYAVRFVRGARTRSARWSEVSRVATSSPGGIACLVITLRDGTETILPVAAVAHDRDDLVREVQRRLRGRG